LCVHRSLKALADLFALERIYNDTRMHDWDYIAPDKVGEGGGGGRQCGDWVNAWKTMSFSPWVWLRCGSHLVFSALAACRRRPLTPHPALAPTASLPQAKAIYRLMEALCGELRGVAVPLVDSFAIPDHILRAPIGLSTTAVDPYSEYLAAAGFDA
jgi:acyl-CoA oxidase